MLHYFATPIGNVLCLITPDNVIIRCEPAGEVDYEVLSYSNEEHPELAVAFASLMPCPKSYAVEMIYRPLYALSIWEELCKVPYGTTLSYKEFTEQLGLPAKEYVRQVASTLAKNKCFFLIPCHRIVRADGDIGGFKWGKELKAKLLAYEATHRR